MNVRPVGPLVVGAVELVGMVMVPLVVRVSGCVDGLECLGIGTMVAGVAVLACAITALVVLWLVARRPPRRPAWTAAVGATGWMVFAATWLAVGLGVGGTTTVVEIVVADVVGVAGTVGTGYLAVDVVRRGGVAVGWFAAAAVAVCGGLCLIGRGLAP